jgi:hypothetical protein
MKSNNPYQPDHYPSSDDYYHNYAHPDIAQQTEPQSRNNSRYRALEDFWNKYQMDYDNVELELEENFGPGVSPFMPSLPPIRDSPRLSEPDSPKFLDEKNSYDYAQDEMLSDKYLELMKNRKKELETLLIDLLFEKYNYDPALAKEDGPLAPNDRMKQRVPSRPEGPYREDRDIWEHPPQIPEAFEWYQYLG